MCPDIGARKNVATLVKSVLLMILKASRGSIRSLNCNIPNEQEFVIQGCAKYEQVAKDYLVETSTCN